MEPVISIVVLTYNIENLVLETLNSIYEQTYKNIELIVSDDCSRDNTVEKCNAWIKENADRFVDAKIVVAKKNGGIPANCNQGLKIAKGEWLKIIAGDDLFFPHAIQRFVDEINKDVKKNRLAYHTNVIEFQDGKPLEIENKYGDRELQNFNREETTPEEQFKILLRFCPVYAPTVLLHKSVYEKVGYFDERFRLWEDRPMWLKMTSNGIKIHFINEELVKYRRHDLSVQVNSNKTLLSGTTISQDQGFHELILPNLPTKERLLHSYLIFIRKSFLKIFNNKKNLPINIVYKMLTLIPEKILKQIKSKHKP